MADVTTIDTKVNVTAAKYKDYKVQAMCDLAYAAKDVAYEKYTRALQAVELARKNILILQDMTPTPPVIICVQCQLQCTSNNITVDGKSLCFVCNKQQPESVK